MRQRDISEITLEVAAAMSMTLVTIFLCIGSVILWVAAYEAYHAEAVCGTVLGAFVLLYARFRHRKEDQ